MRKIKVAGSDADGSMLISIDGLTVSLTAAEAAYLDSQMAAAHKTYKIVNDTEADAPGAPLTKVRPSRF